MIRGFFAAALAAALLSGCDGVPWAGRLPVASVAANATQASAPETSAERKTWSLSNGSTELGRKVYNFRCYYCHGYSGDAKTLAARFLFPPPRDFTTPHVHNHTGPRTPTDSQEHAAGTHVQHADTHAHSDARPRNNDEARTPGGMLTRDAIYKAVRNGRPDTAMKSFAAVLSEAELNAVADFVYDEFVIRKAPNTRYHTAANGWPDHDRYRAAFPFATGELALDTPPESLNAQQASGRRLYMGSCVSCHDRSRTVDEGPAWELRAMSYPPNEDACAGCHRYSRFLHQRGERPDTPSTPEHAQLKSITSGTAFAVHDVAPILKGVSPLEKRGETIYQQNCSFCHAADGSGRNWIGAFLEPHPRDLRDPQFRARTSPQTLIAVIREGLPGTSMPAWKTVLAQEELDAVAAYVLRAFAPAEKAARR